MKRITKKALSLGLVAMLCLSMCMVSFAAEGEPEEVPTGAESTGDPDVDGSNEPDVDDTDDSVIKSTENPDAGKGSTPDPGAESTQDPSGDTSKEVTGDLSKGDTLSQATINGENVMDKVTLSTVSASFYSTMTNPDSVRNIFRNIGISYDKADYLASVDITFDGEIPRSGITLTFDVAEVTTSDVIYAIHQKQDGTYEVIKCQVPADGKISITLYSLSPVSFYKLEGAKSMTTPSSASKGSISPKTGAF